MPEDPEHDEPLERLLGELQQRPGLNLAVYDRSFLRSALAKRVQASGLKSVADYGAHLASNRREAAEFDQALRIGYSEFFRNSLTFALLEQQVLPSLAATHKPAARGGIRVWSAGCAAGQEAWSVAMLLDAVCGTGESAVPYRIFATDWCPAGLTQARAGVYSADAVGNIRERHLREYFLRQGETFVIIQRLRQRVDFSVYDLLDESSSSPEASIYGDFDLILCCNLLFYYRADIRHRILNKLCRALAPGGYVVTGEVERDTVAAHEELHAVAPLSAVFKRLGSTTAEDLPRRPAAPLALKEPAPDHP